MFTSCTMAVVSCVRSALRTSAHGKWTAALAINVNMRSCASSSAGGTVNREETQRLEGVPWWDPSGPMAALHTMNALRVPLIKNTLQGSSPDDTTTLDQVPHPLQGWSVLDIGCGAGILSEPLARLGAEVTGIDPSETNIAMARHHASLDSMVSERVRYECTTVEDFVSSGSQFDTVVASEVVEHVTNLGVFVNELCKLVKPDGWALFTTINRTFLSYLLVIVAAEYVLGMVPRGSHTWEKFVPPAKLSQYLHGGGMKVDFCRGMMLNPISLDWTWVEDTSVNYALRATKTRR